MTAQAYDWRKDALDCYHLALRLIALRRGAVRPATPCELYYAEMHGVIP
jgi:hypothetical protein